MARAGAPRRSSLRSRGLQLAAALGLALLLCCAPAAAAGVAPGAQLHRRHLVQTGATASTSGSGSTAAASVSNAGGTVTTSSTDGSPATATPNTNSTPAASPPPSSTAAPPAAATTTPAPATTTTTTPAPSRSPSPQAPPAASPSPAASPPPAASPSPAPAPIALPPAAGQNAASGFVPEAVPAALDRTVWLDLQVGMQLTGAAVVPFSAADQAITLASLDAFLTARPHYIALNSYTIASVGAPVAAPAAATGRRLLQQSSVFVNITVYTQRAFANSTSDLIQAVVQGGQYATLLAANGLPAAATLQVLRLVDYAPPSPAAPVATPAAAPPIIPVTITQRTGTSVSTGLIVGVAAAAVVVLAVGSICAITAWRRRERKRTKAAEDEERKAFDSRGSYTSSGASPPAPDPALMNFERWQPRPGAPPLPDEGDEEQRQRMLALQNSILAAAGADATARIVVQNGQPIEVKAEAERRGNAAPATLHDSANLDQFDGGEFALASPAGYRNSDGASTSGGTGMPPSGTPGSGWGGSTARGGSQRPLAHIHAGLWRVRWQDLEVQKQIGEGSFGKVFLAKWRETTVAVKLLTQQPLGEEDPELPPPAHDPILDNLEKEASLMAAMRHPNVVMYLGLCAEPPCVVTEYCARGSLTDVLKRARLSPAGAQQMDWSRRLSMALDAAKGMNYLHNSEPPVIHRDLKSPNLLVDKHWRVKVCDFNLSRVMEESVVLSSMAASNPRWLAPEILSGRGYTFAADVYSFGMIMWELLTWQVPWHDCGPWQVVALVTDRGQRPDIPPRDSLPGAPFAGLDDYVMLMQSCWAQTPEHRPTFGDVITVLRALLAGETQARTAARQTSDSL